MSFNDFIHKNNLNNRATSNVIIQFILTSLALNNVGIFLIDGPFKTDIRMVYLHPSKGTHWAALIHESFLDSYGCPPPQRQPRFIIK